MTLPINLIAAVGKSGQVGLNGNLPWHDPEDLKWFREMTTGGMVIVGEKTWPSVQHLDGSQDRWFVNPFIWDDFQPVEARALVNSENHNAIWIAGGPATWRRWAPHITRLYINRIDYDGDADATFPFDAFPQLGGGR
ncbi:MAG: dihydrofolate reductase [Pseudomonadota bacterium]